MKSLRGFDVGTTPMAYQAGQAVVEAIVSLMVLGVLIHVVAATDRLQDLALRASLAGRYAATLLTRQVEPGNALAADVADRFFNGSRHRWQTRDGESMLEGASSVRLAVAEGQGVAGMQVGQMDAIAGPIRQEVLRRDRGITHATVDVQPRLGRRKVSNGKRDGDGDQRVDRGMAQRADRGFGQGVDRVVDPFGLTAWESMTPRLRRHTAILTDAGHAHSDAGVTARLQASPQTWATSAARSAQHGRDVASQLARIDRPWNRPAPQFDWLTPWEHLVPADRVGKKEDASWRR